MGLLDLYKKLTPLNEETSEEAMIPFAPEQTEVAPVASAPISSPVMEQMPIQEIDVSSRLAPIYEKREPIKLARVKIPDGNDEDQKERERQLLANLSDLKDRYVNDRDSASKRQMYAEMLAALGNNIGNISAGQAAMASGANVQAPKTQVNVKDMVGQVEKRFDKDYDNLLKQYKGLKDGQLTAKDKFQADVTNAYLGAKEAGLNANLQNTDRNALTRGVGIELKHQKDDELSDKQEKELSDYDTALASLSRTKSMKKGIDTGPIANLRNSIAQGVGWDDPKVSALRAQIVNDLSERVKQLSGTAASDKEREALSFTLPSLSNNEGTFDELLTLAESRIKEAKAIRENNLRRKQGKNVAGYKQPGDNAPQSSGTVTIMGPSGQTATVRADAAEKYLSKPGYKRVD